LTGPEWNHWDFERVPPCMGQSNSKTIIIKFDVSNFRFRRYFFPSQKPKMVGRGPFPSLQRLSPSSSFKTGGKICQGNLTRIDHTTQKFSATGIGLVVSDDGACVASGFSEKSAQRAQFTISTQGIVTHSQAQGSGAGAQPTFFMSARPKPAETRNLSLARLNACRLGERGCRQGRSFSAPTLAQADKWLLEIGRPGTGSVSPFFSFTCWGLYYLRASV